MQLGVEGTMARLDSLDMPSKAEPEMMMTRRPTGMVVLTLAGFVPETAQVCSSLPSWPW